MIMNYWTLMHNLQFKYDEIEKCHQGDVIINYGIIHGSETIVFIKLNYGSTIYDYRYVKTAREVHDIYNCTVIVGSNPNGYKNDFESEMKFVQAYAEKQNLGNLQIYYMGFSIGASLGMIHGYKYPFIKRMLFLDGSLFRFPEEIINGIRSFSGEKITFVYGKEGPSKRQSRMIKKLEKENVSFYFYRRLAYLFSNSSLSFKELLEKYLF